jgi:hypothetical protein
MGLFNILGWTVGLPWVGPWKGTMWTLEKVQRVVEEELTDDTPVKEELMNLQLALEMGDIDDEEYAAREAELMQRLREVRDWREALGKSVGGGPVRVAREEERE